jgi:hypothetical protein
MFPSQIARNPAGYGREYSLSYRAAGHHDPAGIKGSSQGGSLASMAGTQAIILPPLFPAPCPHFQIASKMFLLI